MVTLWWGPHSTAESLTAGKKLIFDKLGVFFDAFLFVHTKYKDRKNFTFKHILIKIL